MKSRLVPVAPAAATIALAACGSGSGESAATDTNSGADTVAAGVDTTVAESDDTAAAAGAEIDAARCEANKSAGKITYLSGFDFAATASIVDAIVADAKGYYAALCLDVELKASFSTANYPLVAGNEAQFASGGSFSEVVEFSEANEADLVALAVEGKTGIDELIVKDGEAATIADLKGTTIGVKGRITPSVKAMLAQAGLVEGTDYQTVLIDGFDPTVHIALPTIVGFPGYKSNEPGILERAGVKFHTFNPADDGIPGSFGVLYTNQEFLDAHPDAAADFMRATMKGLADAIADPAAAAATAVEYINGAGNPNYLSAEGESFRWTTESKIVVDNTPAGEPIGLPDGALLQAELDAYTAAGIFTGTAPAAEGHFSDSILKSLYDDEAQVIWPG